MKARELIEKLLQLDLDCPVFLNIDISGHVRETIKAPIQDVQWHNEDGNPHLRIYSTAQIEVRLEEPTIAVACTN